MATDKQVQKIAIQLYQSDGVTTSGDVVSYDVWNFDGRWRTDWLAGSANTRSLAGFDRVGVGGFRLDLRITFRNMPIGNEFAPKLRTLLNNVFAEPAFPKLLMISPDNDIANGHLCNIRSSAYGIRRELTVGRQAVNFQFTGVNRVSSIPETYVIG